MFLWNHFFKICGILWCIPSSLIDLVEVWQLGPFLDRGLLCGGVFLLVILWSIWKGKNNRFFRGSSSTIEDLIPLVVLCLAKSLLGRKEFLKRIAW